MRTVPGLPVVGSRRGFPQAGLDLVAVMEDVEPRKQVSQRMRETEAFEEFEHRLPFGRQ